MVKGPSWLAKLGTLSLLYVSVFLTRIGFGSILVIFPYYLNIPLSNSSLAGIIIALYPAVEGFSALPVGTFVDLGGRRKAFVAGMTMISILTLIRVGSLRSRSCDRSRNATAGAVAVT